jgi:predicted secreted acid phosphatase
MPLAYSQLVAVAGKIFTGTLPTARLLTSLLLFGSLIGCSAKGAPAPSQAQPAATSAPPAQPANVGDAKLRATAYHDSGDYDRDLAVVAHEADLWIAQRAAKVARPALVLDIDETSLSNWPVIKADDYGYVIPGPCTNLPEGPCGWQAWDLLGRDVALDATLKTFQQAKANKVTVFFITGRPESRRLATERNLREAGYGGYERLYMTPDGAHYQSAADYKAPVRKRIEDDGYTIIANMGDQPSDLAGGHAEKVFLLPDPFYRIP